MAAPTLAIALALTCQAVAAPASVEIFVDSGSSEEQHLPANTYLSLHAARRPGTCALRKAASAHARPLKLADSDWRCHCYMYWSPLLL